MLLVTQFRVAGLLVLSAAGDSLAMIGRTGSGPGEFAAPFEPRVLKDTIWAPDLSGTVLRYQSSGKYLDQFRFRLAPLGPFQYAPRFMAPLADGSLLYRGQSNPVGDEAKAAVKALALIRVSRTGEVLDTVAETRVRESNYVLRMKDGRGMVGSHPAADPDLAVADPLGRWFSVIRQEITDPTNFGFTNVRIGVTGDTISTHFVATRPLDCAPLREAWVDRLAKEEEFPRAALLEAADRVPFPEYQPPANGPAFADDQGRIWVRSPHPARDSAYWYVVDRTGRTRKLALASKITLVAAWRHTVWGWATGAYDEPYILKFRAIW